MLAINCVVQTQILKFYFVSLIFQNLVKYKTSYVYLKKIHEDNLGTIRKFPIQVASLDSQELSGFFGAAYPTSRLQIITQ